ncbi:MAG TPA: hypothetical protein VH702_21380 [Vicinamibacterales bacterium]|jgi:hypothetical protein
MSHTVPFAVATAILVTASAITTAAPGQNTDRPGYPTRPNVWVENRGAGEAVPVVLHAVATPTALPVQLAGTATVAIDPASVVQARHARQQWEYRMLNIGRAQDPSAALNAAGMEGWEAIDVQAAAQTGTVVLLKRPR